MDFLAIGEGWQEFATTTLDLSQETIDAIADAVWGKILDTTYTAEEMLRLIAAATAGKASGAETNQIIFRDLADSKNRIVATVDNKGNREAVVHDAS